MGPLVTREHRDKVASYLDKGREQGATIVADGREHPLYKGDGFFLGLSLLDKVTPDMDCYRNEIFGPVLEVVRVPTYADAVRLVNDNPYGNGTAIFTRDGGAARQFQFEVKAGMVGHQRADPGAGRLLHVRWLEERRSSATCTCTAPRASSSTPGPRSSRRAGPTRAPARSTWASRAPARFAFAARAALTPGDAPRPVEGNHLRLALADVETERAGSSSSHGCVLARARSR